jgi:hypothetical protein
VFFLSVLYLPGTSAGLILCLHMFEHHLSSYI